SAMSVPSGNPPVERRRLLFEKLGMLVRDAFDSIEQGTQMRWHRLLGADGVLIADRTDDLDVLTVHHLWPAFVFQRQVAHPVELRFDRGNKVPGVRMPGDVEDQRMHLLIELEEAGR